MSLSILCGILNAHIFKKGTFKGGMCASERTGSSSQMYIRVCMCGYVWVCMLCLHVHVCMYMCLVCVLVYIQHLWVCTHFRTKRHRQGYEEGGRRKRNGD